MSSTTAIAHTTASSTTSGRDQDLTRLTDRLIARTEELLEAREALRSLRRMKLEFLQLVSHELRTPLTSILALSEFLGRYPFSSSDEVRELAHGIRSEALRLTRFVEDTVEYLELRGGVYHLRTAPVDLTREIDQVVAVCRALYAGKNLDVRVDRPESLLFAADARAIRRTVHCLVDNAMKFSRSGGTVEVSARGYGDAPDDRWVIVRITNEGEGLARERAGQLFDPFSICHSYAHHTRGWGLGLAAAFEVARVHDGSLRVANRRARKGCEVTLCLPGLPADALLGIGSTTRKPAGE